MKIRRAIPMTDQSFKFKLTNQSYRHPLVEGGDGRPLASALLSGRVPDLLHQRLPIWVLVGHDVGCDLDEEGVQFAFVPLLEHLEEEERGRGRRRRRREREEEEEEEEEEEGQGQGEEEEEEEEEEDVQKEGKDWERKEGGREGRGGRREEERGRGS